MLKKIPQPGKSGALCIYLFSAILNFPPVHPILCLMVASKVMKSLRFHMSKRFSLFVHITFWISEVVLYKIFQACHASRILFPNVRWEPYLLQFSWYTRWYTSPICTERGHFCIKKSFLNGFNGIVWNTYIWYQIISGNTSHNCNCSKEKEYLVFILYFYMFFFHFRRGNRNLNVILQNLPHPLPGKSMSLLHR